MLWNNIKIECKKAMGTRLFLFVVLTGCIITMFSLVPCVRSYDRYISSLRNISEEFSYIRNPMMPSQTLFNYWIGSEAVTAGSTNFFSFFRSWCAFRMAGPTVRSGVADISGMLLCGPENGAIICQNILPCFCPADWQW